MSSYAFAALVAAAKPLDPNDVKPGWIALGVVVLLCIATYFLARSFIKHARKAQQPWEGENGDSR
jgi:hypothetical protein